MCIRDRYGTDMDNLYLDFSIYNSFLQDKYDLLLDGYKDYWEREANIPAYSYEPYSFFQRPGHYYKAVSYTHLDVYKRQSMIIR